MIEEIDNRAEKLIAQLKEKNLKISVAESCTGGMISSKLVGISGASQVFYEGVITYSKQSKIDRLKVSKEIIEKYGVVSKEVVEAMVRGLTTEVGISTTGVAGPDGGTEENPVGTVYIGIRYLDEIKIEKCFFQGTREQIREKATDKAIELGLEVLSKFMREKEFNHSANKLWGEFLKNQEEKFIKKNKFNYTYWQFGGFPDELADLVLKNTKRATASLYRLYEEEKCTLPKIGDYSVILNSENEAICIIKTIKTDIKKFKDVDEEFAFKEGEGDKTLEYWKKVHKKFFSICVENFNEDMEVFLEEFQLVYPKLIS